MNKVSIRTCSSLPECSAAFLAHDGTEAVEDTVVCGLASSGAHLESCFNHISRCHQGGGRCTFTKIIDVTDGKNVCYPYKGGGGH